MDSGAGSSDTIRTISWSAALRPRHEANATSTAPCLPGSTSGGRRSNTTVMSSPVAAAKRSSSSMSRRTARSGSFHHRSGREPIRFMPSTIQRTRRSMASGLSARLPDGLDQVPLAHARTAGDVPLLGHLVEILPRSILEVPAGLAAPGPGLRRLPAEVLSHRLRQVEDGLLLPRGLSRLHDVPLGRADLLLRRHAASPPA